jgi:hypothetical protein
MLSMWSTIRLPSLVNMNDRNAASNESSPHSIAVTYSFTQARKIELMAICSCSSAWRS